jgi:tetratricopeptide (TPR) repeat protein
MSAIVPESGSLAEVSLPRIILDLYANRFTGVLELSRARTRKSFVLQDGALVGSESNLPAEKLCVILEDAGLLSRLDRSRVDAEIRSSGSAEGVALLSLQVIEAKQLFEGLREQLRKRVIECFGWTSGDFRIEATESRSDDVQPFRMDPFKLAQEGVEKHWNLDRMLETLTPNLNQYASAGSRLGKVVHHLSLDATVERMIAGLSGNQTLATIIGPAVNSPPALAAFWVLDAAGALVYSDNPPASKDEDGPAEIEIEISETGEAAASSTASGSASGPASAQPEAKANPEAEKLRAEVLDRLERLDSLSYYELLGVEREATHAAIRKAYFMTAKRYHPDVIARLGLHDIRSQAGEVFSKITEANEVLSNADRRETYNQQLDGGAGEIDLQTLAQAETFYRKGEILINMGDFRGALDYLKNAVDLYPHEAVYQSDLAWTYFKKAPPEPEPALEHIRLALELDPEDAVAQFRLGVIELQGDG